MVMIEIQWLLFEYLVFILIKGQRYKDGDSKGDQDHGKDTHDILLLRIYKNRQSGKNTKQCPDSNPQRNSFLLLQIALYTFPTCIKALFLRLLSSFIL